LSQKEGGRKAATQKGVSAAEKIRKTERKKERNRREIVGEPGPSAGQHWITWARKKESCSSAKKPDKTTKCRDTCRINTKERRGKEMQGGVLPLTKGDRERKVER